MKQLTPFNQPTRRNRFALSSVLVALALFITAYFLTNAWIESAVDFSISRDGGFSFFLDETDRVSSTSDVSPTVPDLSKTLDPEYANQYTEGANAPPAEPKLNFTLDIHVNIQIADRKFISEIAINLQSAFYHAVARLQTTFSNHRIL